MSVKNKGGSLGGAEKEATQMKASDDKKSRKQRASDIGRALRTIYDDTLRESVPDDFSDLLGKLSRHVDGQSIMLSEAARRFAALPTPVKLLLILSAALLPIGRSEIELLEPINPNGGVAKFLEKRGEGLHHVCLETPDVAADLAAASAAGLPLIAAGVMAIALLLIPLAFPF